MGESIISTVTIPLSEYERLRRQDEAAKKKFDALDKIIYSIYEARITSLENTIDSYKINTGAICSELSAIKSKWWYKLFSRL